MAEAPVDFWAVLEDATQSVERWPEWKQRYEADVYYEGSARNRRMSEAESVLTPC